VKAALITIFGIGVATAQARYPAGKALLREVDRNLSSSNRIVSSSMIIHGRRATRTVRSRTWGVGEARAFTEYLAPARERGTKMLKLADTLWMYSPSTDRTIQISGHMLRQSVMGSDLSYEDMMEDRMLSEEYEAEVIGEESIDDRPCWLLQLRATVPDAAYHTRRIWVDRERKIPLRQELYAKSGRLLKRLDLEDIRRVDDRWYPYRMRFKDMLKRGEGTEFIVEEIEFDGEIPAHLLSKAALRR
jgi:outer membrane lipoprotein-sorting protein